MASTQSLSVASTAEQGFVARIRSADAAEQAYLILRTAFTVDPSLFAALGHPRAMSRPADREKDR